MPLSIPEPLKLEHNELHEDLAWATKAGGRVGEAAKAVARVLRRPIMDEVGADEAGAAGDEQISHFGQSLGARFR